jgi:hypothetical protein
MDFCQQLMTVAEANQIMQPSAPATTIDARTSDGGGACNYDYGPFQPDLVISFLAYTGPVPVPQQAIAAGLVQLANDTGAIVTSFTPISGIGDQAVFIGGSSGGGGVTAYYHVFYVLYGKLLFNCATAFVNTSGPADATQKSQLRQCAEQVLSRL